ncbi:MAG: YrdB family protein [Caldilineaceae bacterium]|nr:YrdB family protein [Caldilineaceae bacterium]
MILSNVGLALHFLLEICALLAIGFWGFRSGDGLLMDAVLGIGVPLLAAATWATFRVPNDPGPAPVAVAGPVRLAIEWAIFGLAAGSLAVAGQQNLAWVFVAAAVLDYVMMYERVLRLMGAH